MTLEAALLAGLSAVTTALVTVFALWRKSLEKSEADRQKQEQACETQKTNLRAALKAENEASLSALREAHAELVARLGDMLAREQARNDAWDQVLREEAVADRQRRSTP